MPDKMPTPLAELGVQMRDVLAQTDELTRMQAAWWRAFVALSAAGLNPTPMACREYAEKLEYMRVSRSQRDTLPEKGGAE